MRHTVQYQYRPHGDARPLDYGQPFELEVNQTVWLPTIGDHVYVGPDQDGEDAGLNGVVENRFFQYIQIGPDMLCLINIVLTDSNTDHGKLLKA